MILDNTIVNSIRELYEELLAKGEIFPTEKLAGYYETFRRKFGPERLSKLDGEELLSTMHDSSNRDSLVYWLEFKNDDEYPGYFGSIAGGSALKFGIYRRKETGGWVAGSPQYQEQLTVQQAVQIARKHREQLFAGIELLKNLPSDPQDSDYLLLQDKLSELAPDISDSTWVHKYFHMLFPDKIEDFHIGYYQRFYLIKLLQIPISTQGRYAMGGQYMRIAKELGIQISNLTRILVDFYGRPHNYWAIKANYVEKQWKNWDAMRDGGFTGIGWKELGDLSDIKYDQTSKNKIKVKMQEIYNEKGRWTNEIFNFVAGIVEGDIIVATEGNSKVIGVGRVTGNYYYEASSAFCHRHTVDWLSDKVWDIPEKRLKSQVVGQLSFPESLVEIEKQILGRSSPLVITQPAREKTFSFSGILSQVNNILERKRQAILYGPPGTGKTHWASESAKSISAYDAFGRDFQELSDEQKSLVIGNAQQPGFVRFCTFHPSYGYEDFIEGYKPKSNNGVLTFEERPGIFKAICQSASSQPNRKFFLIIDEINRGDIPRIFGELLTILEKDKRGRSLFLPVSGESFSVPDNVYIIGTMNTADRSIALLDTALRRRFGFIELMPDPSVLENATLESIPLGPWLQALNQRILQSIGRDARNLQIGHAYLLENGKPIKDFPRFVRVLQEDIIPLLEEYCYEDYEALEKILGEGLVERERQRVRHELFSLSRRDDLIRSLLQPSPEITASSAALQQDQEIVATEEELDGETS